MEQPRTIPFSSTEMPWLWENVHLLADLFALTQLLACVDRCGGPGSLGTRS